MPFLIRMRAFFQTKKISDERCCSLSLLLSLYLKEISPDFIPFNSSELMGTYNYIKHTLKLLENGERSDTNAVSTFFIPAWK